MKLNRFIKNGQPEDAVNYSCLFFLSIYNLFINKNYEKNLIKYRIIFINKYKLKKKHKQSFYVICKLTETILLYI
jgi:hypothetical protein